jgi:hypothetical protein
VGSTTFILAGNTMSNNLLLNSNLYVKSPFSAAYQLGRSVSSVSLNSSTDS